MGNSAPFILLDDARAEAAASAHLYEEPVQIFVAQTADQVSATLDEADRVQRENGGYLAGYIAYEAGLAMEPRLAHLANARTGSNGPLVWMGLFESETTLAPDEVSEWLSERAEGTASIGPLEPQISLGNYSQNFAKLQEAISAGEIYQANLTFPLAGSFRGDPVALYAALRGSSQAGYGGLIFDGSHWLLSLSPELFVSLRGGEAKAKPMKGTRPRGTDEAQDAALARDLSSSVKDKAENLMIVDLMRNDLSRVAEPGSVTVEEPFAIESYPSVHQMVSTVRARLQADKSAFDIIRSIFPCGSITGAPKIRAMELINEVERDARGPYCGAIGRIGPRDHNGQAQAAFNVAIRTLRLAEIENGQGQAVLGVGSAIVADSDLMTEWRECILKGSFVRASSPELRHAQFDLIETMRFEPESGIALLEKHLERMKTSAGELGLSFDRHAARNQIHALCFELEQPAKIRLLAARSGAIALSASDISPPDDNVTDCIALPHPTEPGDWRLRHKTTDRSFYEAARRAAKAVEANEAILVREDGLITEGSFTNIFIERDGMLLTPPASLGLLPGILRASLLEEGKAQEAQLTLDDLTEGFLLGNALRGLFPARLMT